MSLTRYETKDYAQGTFLTGISSGALSFQVQSGEGALFPSAYDYYLVLETISTNAYGVETVTAYEQIRVTNLSTDTFTIVRGQNGTTPTAFSADDRVSLHVVSKIFEDIQDAIEALETNSLTIASFNSSLRDDLTAWRLIYVNGSGDETELALGTSGQVLQTNGASSAPSWTTPSTDINSLTEESTPDTAVDMLLMYDDDGATNKKIAIDTIAPSAGETTEGLVERLTDAEAVTATDTTRYASIAQIEANYGNEYATGYLTRSSVTGIGTLDVAHGMTKPPRLIEFYYCYSAYTTNVRAGGSGVHDADAGNDYCLGNEDGGSSVDMDLQTNYSIFMNNSSGGGFKCDVSAIDATDFTMNWTDTGGSENLDVYWVAYA